MLNGEILQGIDIDFIAEMSGVCDKYAIFHGLEMCAVKGVTYTGNGQNDIRLPAGIKQRHHLVTVHGGIGCLDCIHFADDDFGTQPCCSQGAATTTPAKTNNCNVFACQHQVC